MKDFDKIDKTVNHAASFLKSYNSETAFKEVPTCIVETSCESSSNNETQFFALCRELEKQSIFTV